MKRFIAIIGVIIVAICVILVSCKKEDTEEIPVDTTPSLIFMTGPAYVSSDTTLEVNETFKVGVLGSNNPNTNIDLATFKVNRIFEGVTETVYEEFDISNALYTWQDSLTANSEVGDEKWTFIVTDEAGKSNELSFIVTTQDLAPYTPVFSPTYLIAQQGGVELLDFYITCVTDDWEMIKIVVTYPGGLGSEVYIGSGQVITVGSPFTFSNYFPKIGGTWTFSILGSIKSGVHVNESFTAITLLTVPAK